MTTRNWLSGGEKCILNTRHKAIKETVPEGWGRGWGRLKKNYWLYYRRRSNYTIRS